MSTRSVDMYDELAELYDLFIDWPNRLKTELPLLEKLGAGLPGDRVIDAACGTGHHARAWEERGCDVLALDASEEMVARARAADPTSMVDWQVGGLDEVPGDRSADSVVCLGTSLPHVSSAREYADVLSGWASALRPGGRLVVGGRNLTRVLRHGERYLEPLPRLRAGGVVLFWRFYDIFPPDHVDFHLAIFDEADGWKHRVLTSRLCVVDAEGLVHLAVQAGLREVRVLGHLDGRPYDEETSPDLALIARG